MIYQYDLIGKPKVKRAKFSKNPRCEFEKMFIETEIMQFRHKAYANGNKKHYIFCYSKEVAQAMASEIKKRFKKYNWTARWYYNLIEDYFVVEVHR